MTAVVVSCHSEHEQPSWTKKQDRENNQNNESKNNQTKHSQNKQTKK